MKRELITSSFLYLLSNNRVDHTLNPSSQQGSHL